MIIVAKNACITAQTCVNLCLTEKAVAVRQESKS
jgi:NAD-dependent dihydropyrimidine dehydrogenase PreA subunit